MTKKRKNPHFDCKDVESHLHAFIDGKMSTEDEKLFEQHLEYCLPCEKKVDFDLKLKMILRLKARENVHPKQLDSFLKEILSNPKAII